MTKSLWRSAVRFLPDTVGMRLTIALANRPARPPLREVERAALASARRFSYGEDRRLAAWSWGSGPAVVLVHGWGGRAAQMGPMASAVAAAGYRAIALDVTGHGDSPGRSTAWSFFMRDAAALADTLNEPIHAFIGHSAGGLATMAARRHGRIRAKRYVCIASPSYPYPPIEAVRKRLDPPASVILSYQRYLAGQLDANWDELEACGAFRDAGDDLLLIYDHDDRYVEHGQADRIAAVSGASVVKTQGYSHTRVLSAPEALRAVNDFLGKRIAG